MIPPRMQPWIAAAALAAAAVGCEKDRGTVGTAGRIEAPQVPQVAEPPKPPVVPAEISITTSSPEALTSFKRGRYLVENARIDDGLAELVKAVQKDKQFALALAYLGFFTATEEGLLMLERAASLASGLPPPERLYVEHLLTWRRGDTVVLREQRKQLEELAPTDWRVHFELGTAAQEERNWAEAERRFHRAIELNRDAGAAWNMLGYSLIQQGRYDDAVTALQRYAAQLPNEPTPPDTIGEALLRAGKLNEAEKSFARATELAPSFTQAWLGLAQCRFLKGDFAGGRAALAGGAKAASGGSGELDVLAFAVWSHLAERDWGAAASAVGVLERRARALEDDRYLAQAPVLRAAIHAESGAHGKVAMEVEQAVKRALRAKLAGDALSEVYGNGFFWKLHSELQQKKVSAAEKSLLFLSKAVQLAPGPRALSLRSFATGLVSEAKGDKEIAVQQLLECAEDHYLCRAHLVGLQSALGNASEAEKLKGALLASPRRDTQYLYARTLLAPARR